MKRFSDALGTLSGAEPLTTRVGFRSLKNSHCLGYCQPTALSELWQNPLRAWTTYKNRDILIGVHHSIPDEDLPGLLAHEVEHAFEYLQANDQEIILYGMIYGAYEMMPNNTLLGQGLIQRIRMHERLLDMRAIHRGNGEALFTFRQNRKKNRQNTNIPEQYDRQAQYLTDVEIMRYLWGVQDVREDIIGVEKSLGIGSDRVFGAFPARTFLHGRAKNQVERTTNGILES